MPQTIDHPADQDEGMADSSTSEQLLGHPAAEKGEALAYLCRTLAHGDRTSGCWEWPFTRLPTGYGRVAWAGRVRHVPRVSYFIEHGIWPETCRHTCDNPPCFNPAHLLGGTQADNIADKVERGRQQRGEAVPQAKLTEQQVHDIRGLIDARELTHEEIAKAYGVAPSTIHRIYTGESWGWLQQREVGVTSLAATFILALLAALAVLAGARAGAQGVPSPVSYEVGDVLVFASATRNPSCSVTRVVRNTSDQPLRVIASAHWPGQPDHLPPNQGDHGGDAILGPGDQVTAVWTNSHYVTDGALNLTWTVLIPDGVAQIGANHLEAVPACHPETSTTTPPVASSAPPQTTSPPSSTTAPVTSTPESLPPPGVGVTTTTSPGEAGNVPGISTGVLTSSQQRQTLAETGATSSRLLRWGLTLTAVGALIAIPTGRHLRRVSGDQTTPTQDQRS